MRITIAVETVSHNSPTTTSSTSSSSSKVNTISNRKVRLSTWFFMQLEYNTLRIVDQHQSNDSSDNEEKKHWYEDKKNQKLMEVRSTCDFCIFFRVADTTNRLEVLPLVLLLFSLAVCLHTRSTKTIKNR